MNNPSSALVRFFTGYVTLSSLLACQTKLIVCSVLALAVLYLYRSLVDVPGEVGGREGGGGAAVHL